MKKRFIGLAAFFVLIGIDQFIKYIVELRLAGKGQVSVIGNVFHLYYTQNTGAAFSILQNKKIFLIVLVSLVTAAIIYVIMSGKIKEKSLVCGLWMIAAGGVGNLIDRAVHGYVVDYIYFVPINFPVFNFADILITVGAVIMVLGMLFGIPGSKKA